MDNFINRAIFASVFLWLGLHGIGLGMIANGGNHPRNPIWRMLSSLFEAEMWLLKAVIIAALCWFVILIVHFIFSEESQKEESKDISLREGKYFSVNEKPSAPIATTTKIEIETDKPEITIPLPKEKSPEELKREAIKQLTRGW